MRLIKGSILAYALGLVLLAPAVCPAPVAAQHVGGCDGYEQVGARIVFACDGGARVAVRPLSDDVVEVWASAGGAFERANASFAVVRDTLGAVPVPAVTDRGDHWEIAAGALVLRAQKSPFALAYYDRGGRLLGGDDAGGAYAWEGEAWTWRRRIEPGEQVLGLGEKSGALVRNGRTFTMWNSDLPCYDPATDPLYKSIPFYLSTRSYGVFVDNTYRTVFDVGETDAHRLSVRADGGPLVYYVIGGGPAEALDRYTQLTGRPMLPPKWAFGYAQSRGFYTNEPLTRAVAATLRARRIPADIIYQDIGWVEELQNFEWNPDRYDDPEGMLADLEAQGFKVIVSQDPIVSRRNEAQWKELADAGLFVRDRRTGDVYDMPWPWGGNGALVDFTREGAADYWGALQQKVVDQGVDGFWTDMGEPAWSNLDAPDRLFMQHAAGPHAEIHNVYGHTWDAIVTGEWRRRNGNRRIFQMTRAAYAGMQRFTTGWSGDSGCEEDILNGWSRLADQVRIAQSAGLGGLAFWSSDISGYCGDIHDYAAFAPLYVRWMQFGMFNSLSRVHHNGDWAVEPWQFGDAVEDMVRDAVELRYRLIPYLYTYARQSYDTGLPVMRPLVLDYPDDAEALKADTQFLFGEALLVAPVVTEGTARDVYLPAGVWIDYNDPSRREEGGRWITVEAPLGETPVWVKEGAVVPTMPVMQYIHEKPVYPLVVELFPHRSAGRATFELYEDDGTTYAYETDAGSRTPFAVETTEAGWQIEVAARRAGGYTPPGPRNLVFKLHLPEPAAADAVTRETDDGAEALPRQGLTKVLDFESAAAGWAPHPVERVLYVKIPDTGEAQTLFVERR